VKKERKERERKKRERISNEKGRKAERERNAQKIDKRRET
jgi:hypothetical protein